MTTEAPHRLSEKDFTNMTATCAVCGPVNMRTRGKGRPACGKNLAAKRAAWSKRNPNRARRNRMSRSAHRLSSFDPATLTGECPVCGTVGVVPKGRGYMCGVRARELWSVQQDEPQHRCPDCRRNFLRADGTCPYCSDRRHLDWAYALRVEQDEVDSLGLALTWADVDYTLIIDPETHDPYSVEGDTVANPALKTIGAGVPPGLTADSYIKKWWADNGHEVEMEVRR